MTPPLRWSIGVADAAARLREASDQLDGVLARHGLSERSRFAARLVAEEIVLNALEHGGAQALSIVAEEGLEARWTRHRCNAELLWQGLESLDLTLHVPIAYRLPTLTTVRVPDGVDETQLRMRLLNEYNIEIGGGLGELKGRVWRIGLMGYSSNPDNVDLLVSAFEKLLL